MNDGFIRRSLNSNNAKDLGAPERPDRTVKRLIASQGFKSTEISQDYRHLLSPETRKRLEERAA